jgi:hypothetical protein
VVWVVKSLIKKILKEEVHDLLKKHSFKLLNEWLLDECDQITHSDYPDSIFFKRKSDGEIIAEIDKKSQYFWLHYDEIWSFFKKHFELKYKEIREIARDWLEEAFKLRGYRPNPIDGGEIYTAGRGFQTEGVYSPYSWCLCV